ncbi:erythromycin resistance leader peptide [Paenibacillus sp. XY044]
MTHAMRLRFRTLNK